MLDFVSGKFKTAIEDLPASLLLEEEEVLRRTIKPTPCDYSLRVSFWREYEEMLLKGHTKISLARVFRGICSDSYFWRSFVTDENRMAWLIKPVQEYQREIEAILFRGTQRLWQLIDMDIAHPKDPSKVCPRAAGILLETIKMVENRSKGMAIQRSIQKSEVVTEVKATAPLRSLGDITAETKRIEGTLKPMITVGDSIEE